MAINYDENGKRVAVCFSGPARSVRLTGPHLRRSFAPLGKYTVIAYVPTPTDRASIEEQFSGETVVVVQPDQTIDDRAFRNDRFKTGVQRYLQQIYGWYQVNKMRKRAGEFDYVVRCRTDVIFTTKIPAPERLDPQAIHIPDFHHWGGWNDRFCIAGPEAVNHYMNVFEQAMAHPEDCNHSETFLKWCLDRSGVQVKLLDVRFNRVRILPDS